MHYLQFHAKKGTTFLHPGGKDFTSALFSLFPKMDSNAKVLEVGCGTGASLVAGAKRFNAKFTGVDVLPEMISEARERIKLNRTADKVSLVLIEPDGKLPFPKEHFDVVYAESVFAIVNEQSLPVLLSEIFRVLKPTGHLLSADAIWKTDTPSATIKKINSQCLKDFGLVQCISQPAHLEEWQSTFVHSGFAVKEVYDGSEMKLLARKSPMVVDADPYKHQNKLNHLMSKLFNTSERRYSRLLKQNHQLDGSYIEPYLFVLKKHQ